MLIAGGRSSVAWATTKALVRRRDIVLGTHTLCQRWVRRRNSGDAPGRPSAPRTGQRLGLAGFRATAVHPPFTFFR
jgi:hypothetical protein